MDSTTMRTLYQAELTAVRKAVHTHRMEYVTVDASGSFHALCALRCRLQRLVEILAVDELGQVVRWIPDEQERQSPSCDAGRQPEAAGDYPVSGGQSEGQDKADR